MKILQIIPAVPGGKFGEHSIEYYALLENNRGEQCVLACFSVVHISAAEMVKAHIALGDGDSDFAAWAEEP